MSDLTSSEKRKLERLFRMGGGYVLNFMNRTFSEFVDEHTGRDIDDSRYCASGASKANRLRGFWTVEPNYLVGNLLTALIDYGQEYNAFANDGDLPEQCRRIAARLGQDISVPELDALTASGNERDFEILASQVRDAINKNEPEAGLDRLHTFVLKYVRTLCERRGIAMTRDKPLHSLFGEYVKRLGAGGHLESQMTSRILKSSISVLEAFNDVRNDQSLAHDNSVLNYDESLLIFNHVANSVRFLKSLEMRIEKTIPASDGYTDDIPF
jgi:hypothetical protein